MDSNVTHEVLDVFKLRDDLVQDYKNYTKSFITIRDERIKKFVDTNLDGENFWPEPLLQLNPSFESGETIDKLVNQDILHPECRKIFRVNKSDSDPEGKPLLLYKHQSEAIRKAKENKSYILTSGTGSGKSLTYIIPIVDHILRTGTGNGIKALIVYPMNALVNSQCEELNKFLKFGYPASAPPVSFARYTGQEKGEEREQIQKNPPDILLTNYMMLELLLTRPEDSKLTGAARKLKYLVFDELHTYRGRQGADVALLIRRCRNAFESSKSSITCIGTSATLATGGSSQEQKKEVALLAERFFGIDFSTDQVIRETLKRATLDADFKDQKVRQQITDAINSGQEPPSDPEAFRSHPLASWIETTFGIREESSSNLLIRQIPSKLRSPKPGSGAANGLHKITGIDENKCAKILKEWLLHGSKLRISLEDQFPIFAFRLHQFFTRGDTVWASLEREDTRHLEISKKITKPQEPEKLLYPLVFCRNCGAEYYKILISKDDDGNRQVKPLETGAPENIDEGEEGYLYISTMSPWPSSDLVGGQNHIDRLPDDFKEASEAGVLSIKKGDKKNIPESILVDSYGNIEVESSDIVAGLIKGNFLFCLAPECKVAYVKTKRSERHKLATLGVDNRSTATTILAMRALSELQKIGLESSAQKLLSFTDNRQDASFQAGHFNDFVQIAQLRSALYRALKLAGDEGLSHSKLSQATFDALDLQFREYAADSNVTGPARQTTHNQLRRVLEYYIYQDLKRGWRITAANLEDCGLLQFSYKFLEGSDGLLEDNELWESGFEKTTSQIEKEFVETPSVLQNLKLETRKKLCRTLLDRLRWELAIKVDVLNPKKHHELVEATRSRLQEDTIWYLENEKDLAHASIAYIKPIKQGPWAQNQKKSFSAHSNFGRYIKRELSRNFQQGRQGLNRDEITEVIEFLFQAMTYYGILEQVWGGKNKDSAGYQLVADVLCWKVGDGQNAPFDPTQHINIGDTPRQANQYFVDCYRTFNTHNTILEAREHTAQVTIEDRQEREERFRKGSLPLLFCSPTMELGVDISELNMVNLRNIPPTPANYVQRSGRAGRGGEPALVFTYCAGRSPHDQYFFRYPEKMVSGEVIPPRIDLSNHDLLVSHIYAIWMQEAKPQLGKTLADILDHAKNTGEQIFPIKDELLDDLRNVQYQNSALIRATELIKSIEHELVETDWYQENWVNDIISKIEQSFNKACDRWRVLYDAAAKQRGFHDEIITNPMRSQKEQDESRRLRTQAENQMQLLTRAKGIYEGDFYSYRYLATEGLLPGYNFPRLPISAYVPARRRTMGRDGYVSRPRFIAISEFGPRNLIYHEGGTYRVNKVNLKFDVESSSNKPTLQKLCIKCCPKCGYAHTQNLSDNCDICGEIMDASSTISKMIQLQSVSLYSALRITCDEEERKRFGYKIVTAYRFPENKKGLAYRQTQVLNNNGDIIIKLHYSDSTTLYRINTGWAKQKKTGALGFLLDIETGKWLQHESEPTDKDNAEATGNTERVVPFVEDTKNALVMSFQTQLDEKQMVGLKASLKQAIQQEFQLEPRELSVEALPSNGNPRELLFYESSEGGAGVLRQLAEEPKVLPDLAKLALEICHFDPRTLEDLAKDQCGNACYECLLDYGNQIDHKNLDRNLIKKYLLALSKASCESSSGSSTREDSLSELFSCCDSQLEKSWLKKVFEEDLRLPSHAQFQTPDYYACADFFYYDQQALIFIDGPPHDNQDQMTKDETITRDLQNNGYMVIRFHHKDDWDEIFLRHRDIFGGAKT